MAYVRATDGNMIDVDSLPCTNTYSGDLIATETVVDPVTGNTYRKTYTWTGSTLTSETGWVKV